ncbi:MAG: hypothetical protein ACR2GP_08790 [Burkholderiaceae bacterium]
MSSIDSLSTRHGRLGYMTLTAMQNRVREKLIDFGFPSIPDGLVHAEHPQAFTMEKSLPLA